MISSELEHVATKPALSIDSPGTAGSGPAEAKPTPPAFQAPNQSEGRRSGLARYRALASCPVRLKDGAGAEMNAGEEFYARPEYMGEMLRLGMAEEVQPEA